MTARCLWHKCNKKMHVSHGNKKFCSPACQRARGAWKANRGGPLVDMLLNNDAKALIEAKRHIQEEIENAITRTH